MPVIFLTPDNCDYLKHALSPQLAAAKSSHLTEALAAASGYRTHAALLAAIKTAEPVRPPLVLVDPGRFVARLRELRSPSADPVALINAVRAPDMPQAAWREFRSGDIVANNAWFRDCKRRNLPSISVELHITHAQVSWDCISIDPADEGHVRDDRGDVLVREMFQSYQALAKGNAARSEFFGSAFVGSVDRLAPSLARAIADDFLRRLYAPTLARRAA